ncbi:MAG: hypothetical protein Q6J68_01380 [Thermostichales cyanobacterium SZTDM-1c_bins_54]
MIWQLLGILVAGLLLLPLLPVALWSVSQGWYFPHILPQTWTLAGWITVLHGHSGIGEGLLTSLLLGLITTTVALLVGIPAGYALNHTPALRPLLYLPLLGSPLAVVLGLQELLIRLGLQGSLVGVMVVHLLPTVPYTSLVMSSLFASWDPAYGWVARSLGAAPWQVGRYVLGPMLLPGVGVSALFAFLLSWNEFVLSFFVGAGEVLTLPMVLFSLLQGGNYTLIGAVTITSLLPGLVILGLSSRLLQTGIPLVE